MNKKEMKEHDHNWKSVYFRKKGKGNSQEWIKANNYKICDICFKIVKEEVKEIGR